jgi:hypothetical protein
MEASKLLNLLKDLATQLPSLIAILACMVYAIIRWKQFPKVSLVVLIGLGLVLVHSFLFTFIYTWVPDLFLRSTSYPSQASTIRIFYLVLGTINNACVSIALTVLLIAIFTRRPATDVP